MKKPIRILLVFGILFLALFQQCKKPDDDWSFCNGCGLDTWVGLYVGSGSYFKDEGNQITDGVEVQLELGNPSGKQFLIKILAPDYYSQSFFSSKSDSLYSFSIANQNSSVNLSLYKKGTDFKITGVAKKYHWEWQYEPDTAYVLIPDHTLSFEVFKKD